MLTWTTAKRAELHAAVRGLREELAPFDDWPRDGRASARRWRIVVLFTAIERYPGPQTMADAVWFLEQVEELKAWRERELAFLRTSRAGRRLVH